MINEPRSHSLFSKLQVECDEKLQKVYHDLLQAGHDKQESEKEAKFRETLANLQRLFPGTSMTAEMACVKKKNLKQCYRSPWSHLRSVQAQREEIRKCY